jgi:GNAT superfamily N-acetyltransferase
VRPADHERVFAMSEDALDGRDYLSEVFDAWVADPGASFQAAEVDGVVVGIQRLRPIARRLMYYEGLRVAASHRRLGIARSMLREAIREARGLGFTWLRVYTESPDAGRLFTSEGFRLLADCVVWTALRVEGGDPPRLAAPSEAGRLAERLRQDPALAAYGGVNPDWAGPLDVDADLLEHLADSGLVRVAAGGRGMALIRQGASPRLMITFVAGSGAALQDLLTALRFEADAADMARVEILAPLHHPAADDLAEVGYHHADGEEHAYIYALEL